MEIIHHKFFDFKKFVTEEIPITVSRRAPDKEARPITLKSKAKLLKD